MSRHNIEIIYKCADVCQPLACQRSAHSGSHVILHSNKYKVLFFVETFNAAAGV